jgi:4-hydroxybenzoate polyprenyltransferase
MDVEYFKNWFILTRVQSLPVSIITILLAYGTVAETLLTTDVIPLLIIVSIGHLGVYVLNDVYDYEYDKDHKNNDKPLVSGAIERREAGIGSLILIFISLFLTIFFLPYLAQLAYLVAVIIGIIYNVTSKQSRFSSFILGVWGIFIVLTGAFTAGTPTTSTVDLAVILFIHMLLMTIAGDVKDLHAGEPSIPRMLNCRPGVITPRFESLWYTITLVELLFIAAMADFIYYSAIVIIVSMFISYLVITAVDGQYRPTVAKRRITIRELIIVSFTLVASLSFIDLSSMILLLVGSFAWGLLWLRILFGEWLYFA